MLHQLFDSSDDTARSSACPNYCEIGNLRMESKGNILRARIISCFFFMWRQCDASHSIETSSSLTHRENERRHVMGANYGGFFGLTAARWTFHVSRATPAVARGNRGGPSTQLVFRAWWRLSWRWRFLPMRLCEVERLNYKNNNEWRRRECAPKKKLLTISVLKEKPRLQIAYFTLLS